MKSVLALVLAFACLFGSTQAAPKSLTTVKNCNVAGLAEAVVEVVTITGVYCDAIYAYSPARNQDYVQCFQDHKFDLFNLVDCLKDVTITWKDEIAPATQDFINDVSPYVETIRACF